MGVSGSLAFLASPGSPESEVNEGRHSSIVTNLGTHLLTLSPKTYAPASRSEK